MLYETIDTTEEHVTQLCENMCKADIDEIWAAGHLLPMEAVMSSAKASRDTTTGLANGKVVCIYGVAIVSDLTGLGSPWMLSTNELKKHSRIFARRSLLWMEDKKSEWFSLVNYVDARNIRAIKWLKWIGFDIHAAYPYGPDGVLFHKFSWDIE